MHSEIVIEVHRTIIEIEDEASLVQTEETGVSIIEVAEQGMAGPSGSGTPTVEDVVITSPIPTSQVLSQTPIDNSVSVFINGVRQATSAFSVNAATVTLPGSLLLADGDLLTIAYTY